MVRFHACVAKPAVGTDKRGVLQSVITRRASQDLRSLDDDSAAPLSHCSFDSGVLVVAQVRIAAIRSSCRKEPEMPFRGCKRSKAPRIATAIINISSTIRAGELRTSMVRLDA